MKLVAFTAADVLRRDRTSGIHVNGIHSISGWRVAVVEEAAAQAEAQANADAELVLGALETLRAAVIAEVRAARRGGEHVSYEGRGVGEVLEAAGRMGRVRGVEVDEESEPELTLRADGRVEVRVGRRVVPRVRVRRRLPVVGDYEELSAGLAPGVRPGEWVVEYERDTRARYVVSLTVPGPEGCVEVDVPVEREYSAGAAREWVVPQASLHPSDTRGVAAGPDGRVYVGNGKEVIVFDATGALVSALKLREGEFSWVSAVAVRRDGVVCATDGHAHQVVLFRGGEEVARFDETSSDRQLNSPLGVCVTAGGEWLVCDSLNDRVVRLGGEGLAWLGVFASELSTPYNVAAGADGRVFISQSWQSAIAVFAADGVRLRDIGFARHFHGVAVDAAGNLIVTSGDSVLVHGEAGAWVSVAPVWACAAVAVDEAGRVLVQSHGGVFVC